jgi:hypothetical protein
MSVALKKNVKATLTYYDVLEFPLTSFEVWKFLMKYHQEEKKGRATLQGVSQKLYELRSEGEIGCEKGMWFLSERKHLIALRIAREKISIHKLKAMKTLVAWLRYLPFVRMIAATGSLALRHGTKESDWDLLIVLKKDHLFTGRITLTLFLHLIGKRRHGNKIEDRACLNYYCTDKSLLVRPEDWYGAHEYQVMIPLFQRLSPDAFLRANGWMFDLRPHLTLPIAPHKLTLTPTKNSIFVQNFLEAPLAFACLEKILGRWQMQKIRSNPKTRLPGSLIVADEERLIFFPAPRGPKVFDAFHKRLTF